MFCAGTCSLGRNSQRQQSPPSHPGAAAASDFCDRGCRVIEATSLAREENTMEARPLVLKGDT
jgi:hypothetical protein